MGVLDIFGRIANLEKRVAVLKEKKEKKVSQEDLLKKADVAMAKVATDEVERKVLENGIAEGEGSSVSYAQNVVRGYRKRLAVVLKSQAASSKRAAKARERAEKAKGNNTAEEITVLESMLSVMRSTITELTT